MHIGLRGTHRSAQLSTQDQSKSLINTEREAARKLHPDLSPRTMARWRRQGVGPRFVKIGRKVGYTDEALETYIEQNTRRTEVA